jgi:hypothetical protein
MVHVTVDEHAVRLLEIYQSAASLVLALILARILREMSLLMSRVA